MTDSGMMAILKRLEELGDIPPIETLVGCTDEEIAEVMAAQGVTRLPAMYRDYSRSWDMKDVETRVTRTKAIRSYVI